MTDKCEGSGCQNDAVVMVESFFHDGGHAEYVALCLDCAGEACTENQDDDSRPPCEIVAGVEATRANARAMNRKYWHG